MTDAMIAPIAQPAWQALVTHQAHIGARHLRELFAEDPERGTRWTLSAAGTYLDHSKNRIDDETITFLVELVRHSRLQERIAAMFDGEPVDTTECRAALQTALRAPADEQLCVDGVDVVAQVHAVLARMTAFSEQIRSGAWLGHTGRPIRHVINIGIGGSDLGPVMAFEALKHYRERDLDLRFVSNVDGTALAEATRGLDSAQTLFIVCSKSFGTPETLTNARAARAWCLVPPVGLDRRALLAGLGDRAVDHDRHRPGVHFRDMLAGMRAMDEHFRHAPIAAATPAQKHCLAALSAQQVTSTELAGERIESIPTKAPGNGAAIGGIKVVAASGWFAARPSGTEEIYKIYAESFRGVEYLQTILQEAQAMVDLAIRPK